LNDYEKNEVKNERRLIVLLLLLTFLRGVVWAGIMPAYQSPDEPIHMGVIHVVGMELRMPATSEKLPKRVEESLKRSRWWHDWYVHAGWSPGYLTLGAAAHPPLYYYLMAPLYRIFYGAGDMTLVILRLFNVLFALGVTWFAYMTTRIMFPKDEFMKYAVALLVIFQPMNAFVGSAVNNDNLMIFFMAGVIYFIARLLTEGPKTSIGVWLGLFLGGGLLTKASFAFMGPPVILFVLVACLIKKQPAVRAFLFTFMTGAIAMISGSWFYLFNYIKHGWFTRPFTAPYGHTVAGNLFVQSVKPAYVIKIIETFWGNFGWLMIPLDKPIYILPAASMAAAAAGFIIAVAKIRLGKDKISARQIAFFLLLIVLSAVNYLSLAQLDVSTRGGAQGRHMLLTMVPLLILFAYGIRAWVPEKMRVAGAAIVGVASFLLMSLSVWAYVTPFFYG